MVAIKLDTLFKTKCELLTFLYQKMKIRPMEIHATKRIGGYVVNLRDSMAQQLRSKINEKYLVDENVDIVSGFHKEFYRTIYINYVPDDVWNIDIEQIQAELKNELRGDVEKVGKFKNKDGINKYWVLCNSESQRDTFLKTKYFVLGGYEFPNSTISKRTGAPPLQCRNCWYIGHHQTNCKKARRCGKCCSEQHSTDCKEPPFCHFCKKAGHPPTKYSCPERRRVAKAHDPVVKKKTQQEAVKKLKNQASVQVTATKTASQPTRTSNHRKWSDVVKSTQSEVLPAPAAQAAPQPVKKKNKKKKTKASVQPDTEAASQKSKPAPLVISPETRSTDQMDLLAKTIPFIAKAYCEQIGKTYEETLNALLIKNGFPCVNMDIFPNKNSQKRPHTPAPTPGALSKKKKFSFSTEALQTVDESVEDETSKDKNSPVARETPSPAPTDASDAEESEEDESTSTEAWEVSIQYKDSSETSIIGVLIPEGQLDQEKDQRAVMQTMLVDMTIHDTDRRLSEYSKIRHMLQNDTARVKKITKCATDA